MYFNETIVKIVLILLDSPYSQHTDVKTCFLVLWFNCEFRIETDNKKYKQKRPDNSRFSVFKTKLHVIFFSQRGKGTSVKTLEVYNVKTPELFNVKH